MTNKLLMLVGVAALGALPVAGQAQTITLLSENFDELTPTLAATDVGAFHTIANTSGVVTNVDIVGPGLFGQLCHGFATLNCIDLNGSPADGQSTVGILQSKMSFDLKPGNTYKLTYVLNGDLATSNSVSGDVMFGPKTATFDVAPTDSSRNTVELSPGVASTTFITFESTTQGLSGPVIDDVVLTCSGPTCSPGVPEPASLGLLVLGLLGAGFAGRKRRN